MIATATLLNTTATAMLMRFADRQPVALWFLTMWTLCASIWIATGGGLW